ncbi:hypothetical protein C9426_22105 [Serratia sp. S1B]|nr:hypothetical protein C9426_22105 [Serratia sp. S1B]
MSNMLNPEKYNADIRKNQIDNLIKSVGPTNEKSAFLLALMIKESATPGDFIQKLGMCIDAVYSEGEHPSSDFDEMKTFYHRAITIYHKIKDI